jgi:O-acetylhomoserine (thiol)-lyase
MAKLDFSTGIIHTPFPKGDAHGALNIPIYSNAAFEFDSAEDIESAFMGRNPSHIYSRISNPTVQFLEERLRNITGAMSVTALASGMAAISNVMLTIGKAGDNIITTKHLFGNTYSLFESTLKPFGLNVKFADFNNPDEISELIDSNTIAIFNETVTNPHLEVADVKYLSKIAKENNILLITDTTITPPYLFDAKEHGVNIEVISSTKYISGGATSVGGVIIDYGTYNWKYNSKFENEVKKFGGFSFTAKLKKEVHRNIGACLSPYHAFLHCVGLETLTLRADKSCSNCLEIAQFLEKNKKVQKVNYPGLKSSPYFEISKKQFGRNCGAILTFDLESKEQCFKFQNRLKLVRRATNLNDNKTLIVHPASTIFCDYTPEERKELGISEKTLRLSVGIEHPTDIINDIASALNDK